MNDHWLKISALIGFLLVQVTLAFAETPSANPTQPPNVLFIAIDDMNDWTTLFDKDNPIKTPNLERLAKRGTFFTHAYCAAPGCNPSRTAILTGLRPSTSGVYSNGNPWKTLLPDVVTLPQHFKENNYATIGAGKIFHHGGTGTDRADNPSFQSFYKLQLHANKPAKNYNGYVRGRDHRGLASPSWDWGVHDVAKQTDEFTVEYVNQVMATHPQKKPLFLAAGIFRPHLPFWAPPATFTRYPFDKTRLPPMPKDDLDDVPAIGVRMAHTERFIWDNTTKKPEASPGSLKKMVQSYQASADYADEMVGRLLDQLDKTGRAKNTVIVLWSDHGYHLGDKTACVKSTLWEKANHVPFIIVAPGVTSPGTRCDRPVSLVDIYPTLIELAGLPKKDDLDGLSLVPLLKNPEAQWERPALMTQMRGNHAIRSQRWRYIRYSDDTEELYDHQSDPWEWKNLAADPSLAKIKAEHQKWLPEEKSTVRKSPKSRPTNKGGRPLRVAPRKPTSYKLTDNDILLADFEGDSYGDWLAEGKALGTRPSVANITPKNKLAGYVGRGLVNTFQGGDGTTGTLTSPAFTIQRKHINLLVGGGSHAGKTCVDLLVDGKVVRTASGLGVKDTNQAEVIDWHTWDVAPWAGKEARIRIVDQHSGGWGHILVDQIFQSDKALSVQ